MGRPAILDEKILKKIALKKDTDVSSIKKSIDAKARRLRVSSPVALILRARELNIGTATYQGSLDDAQKAELRSSLANPLSPGPLKSPKIQRTERKIIRLIEYDTSDHFKKGHIEELNKAYTFGCNTAVFILGRKIVENLIIDILKKKYPEKIQKNKELYFDTARGRFKDFGVILDNLRTKKADFGSENKAVERLYDLAKPLKDDANDKTHSWYHLVENRVEVDGLNLKAIIEIIKKLEQVVGIR